MKKIICRIIILCAALTAIFALTACDGAEFTFATDIVDNAVFTERNYTFSVTAFCGDEACEIDVNNNGVLLKLNGGVYTAYLENGENKITVTAKSGNRRETRVYTVEYRYDFDITADIDKAKIVNDAISFKATATFNDAACSLSLKHNGADITPSSTDNGYSYFIELSGGKEHKFVFTANAKEYEFEKTYTLYYGEFGVVTTLDSVVKTDKNELDFMFSATYDEEACEVELRANGDRIVPTAGNSYKLVMPNYGKYDIVATLKKGNASKEFKYAVRYGDGVSKSFASISIEDGSSYKGAKYSFDVRAEDSFGDKLKDEEISFSADFDADDKKDEFVVLALGDDLTKVWSDDAKTSYRVDFTQGRFENCINKPLLFRIGIESGEEPIYRTFRMTYVGADKDGAIGRVVFSLEGFTIGCGYFIEPQYLTIYDGEPFSETMTDFFAERGLEYDYTGRIESAFYLARVTGLDLEGNRIPDNLAARVNPQAYSLEKNEDGKYSLGEFDYTSGSGWMYSVNGNFPNYGFSDCFPQDGDVIRVRFTLALGNDIGGGKALGLGASSDYAEFADYAAIHKRLADIRDNITDANRAVYETALKKIAVWDLPQSIVDAQLAALKATYREI